MPGLETDVAAAREAETGFRTELAASEGSFRELAGPVLLADEPLERASLRPRLRALAETSESKLRELARRRRDLAGAADQVKEAAAADADGARQSAEAASAAASEALAAWAKEFGERLENIVQAIQGVFSDVPSSLTDAAAAHTSATRAVRQERQRLTSLADGDAADGRALAEVQESLRQGAARISAIDTELADIGGANEELAQALAAIAPHAQGENCPVCGRDFSEVSSQPLAAHLSKEVARLVAAAGRLQALIRDRTATAAAVAEAQRREAEIAARRLSQSRRDELKIELARLAEWSNELDALAAAARAGAALQKRVALTAQRLAELNSRNSAVIGLRAQVGQYTADLGMPPPEPDAPLGATIAELLAEIEQQEQLETEAKLTGCLRLRTWNRLRASAPDLTPPRGH